MTSKPT